MERKTIITVGYRFDRVLNPLDYAQDKIEYAVEILSQHGNPILPVVSWKQEDQVVQVRFITAIPADKFRPHNILARELARPWEIWREGSRGGGGAGWVEVATQAEVDAYIKNFSSK